MRSIEFRVRRLSLVSTRPFDAVVGRLTASFGHPDIRAFHAGEPALAVARSLDVKMASLLEDAQ